MRGDSNSGAPRIVGPPSRAADCQFPVGFPPTDWFYAVRSFYFYDGYTTSADSATVHAPLPITPANNTAVRHFRLEASYAAGNPKTNLFNMLDTVMNNSDVGLANSLQLQPVCQL